MSLTNNELFRADLHCHSTCSDGTSTPHELVELAKKIGLSGLSITDHDCVDAYRICADHAREVGVSLIPGAEFSAEHKEFSVHILAYSFNPDSELILNFCQRHSQRREERNAMIIELLRRHRMPIDAHELTRPGPAGAPCSIGRPHIAAQMVKHGYVNSIQEAFQLYIGEGKPCFHQGNRPSVEETIDVIHAGGGLAVIAHPHLIKRKKITKDLLAMEFDGIEAYYAKFPANLERHWIEKGNERSWLITGGSDFHGTVKPHIPLGASWAPKETFDILLGAFHENCPR